MSESLTIKAGVDGASVTEGLKGLEERLTQFHERVVAAFAVVGIAAGFGEAMNRAMEQGSKQEELIEGMSLLAGGTEKATARFQQMSALIQKSPFGKENFVEAWKSLTLYTNGLYNNNKALKLVGDVAAATGEPMERISMLVGRAYDSIAAGDGGGRALKQLARVGVISTETADKIGRMGMGKANAGAVWEVLEEGLGKFDGAMEAKSHSWEALMKNFNMAVNSIYGQFAQPIMNSIKPMLEQSAAIATRVALYAKAAGTEIANIIKVTVQAFKQGELFSLISDSMSLGFKMAIDDLEGGLYAAANGFGQAILGIFNNDFGDGLGNIFIGIAQKFAAELMKGLATPLNMLIAAANYPVAKLQARTDVASLTKDLDAWNDKVSEHGSKGMNFLAHGNEKAANREFAERDNFVSGAQATSKELSKALAESNMSLGEYIEAHSGDSLLMGGLNADQLTDKGNANITNGTAEITPIVGKAFDNFMTAIHAAAPAGMFGDLSKEAQALRDRFSKLLNQAHSAEPKEKEIPNPFHEGQFIPGQMQKAVADSFAQIGAGGRVSNAQHFDPMVEQQKLTNDKLDELIGQGDGGDSAPQSGGWEYIQ